MVGNPEDCIRWTILRWAILVHHSSGLPIIDTIFQNAFFQSSANNVGRQKMKNGKGRVQVSGTLKTAPFVEKGFFPGFGKVLSGLC